MVSINYSYILKVEKRSIGKVLMELNELGLSHEVKGYDNDQAVIRVVGTEKATNELECWLGAEYDMFAIIQY